MRVKYLLPTVYYDPDYCSLITVYCLLFTVY